MKRGEIIGTVCAVAAMALVAYLVIDSWRIAECREVLRYADFETAETIEETNFPVELAELKERLESGKTSEEEARCKSKIGLPF